MSYAIIRNTKYKRENLKGIGVRIDIWVQNLPLVTFS